MLAAVAYLDGRLPSVVMARGYYGRLVVAAWDWRNGQLTSRWIFDSGIGVGPFPYPTASPFSGQGQPQPLGCRRRRRRQGRDRLRLDGRGRRRRGSLSTGLGHGDAMHVSDTFTRVKARPLPSARRGMALYDAQTGQILWSMLPGVDVGRGMAADIDPRSPGYEFWGALPGRPGQRRGAAHLRCAKLRESRRVVGRRPAHRPSGHSAGNTTLQAVTVNVPLERE